MTHYDPRLNKFSVIEQKLQSLRLKGTLIFVTFRFLMTIGSQETVPSNQKVRHTYKQAITDKETPIESPIESLFLGWENMSREELVGRLKGLEANSSPRPPPVSRPTSSDSVSPTSVNQLASPFVPSPGGHVLSLGSSQDEDPIPPSGVVARGGGPAVPM